MACKLTTFSLQLVFGRTDACSLGVGEDGCRHDVETDAIGNAKDVVHHAATLHRCSMSQQLAAVDVANGEDMRSAFRLEGVGIDFDAKAVVGDACLVESEVLDVGRAARGNQNHIGLDAFLFAFSVEGNDLSVNLLHTGTHEELDATLLELFAKSLGNIAIHSWQTFLEILNNSDLAAEASENAGKLHADDACTNDAKAAWNLLNVKEFG